MEYLSKIAKEGYPVELSDFAPVSYEDMTPEEREELLVSLALVASYPDAEVDIEFVQSIEEIEAEIQALRDAGITHQKYYTPLLRRKQALEKERRETQMQQIEQEQLEADRELSASTGISVEEIQAERARSREALEFARRYSGQRY